MYIIGYVIKPHGIKGELKVKSVSPFPERFKDLEKIYIKQEALNTYSIERVRIANKYIYLKLVEVISRNEAELLRECEILVEKKDLISLSADEYFIHDLVGCDIVAENGEELGKLIDVMQMTSNDVYVIRSQEGKEILLPAIKDVIKNIDIKTRKIKIHLINGLRDSSLT